MGDFQFWLYVIIGVIYLLSRFAKKKQEEAGPGPEADSREETPRPSGDKQLTFEELLREITEGKTATRPEPAPAPRSVERPAARPISRPVSNYDEDIEEEEQDLEDVNYDYRKKDKIYNEYDEAKKLAFHRPSLEDVDYKDKRELVFEKFKGFDEEKKPDLMKLYLGDIKDPEGLKKAFVVSEILKTKF